jgi:hypothetical protein
LPDLPLARSRSGIFEHRCHLGRTTKIADFDGVVEKRNDSFLRLSRSRFRDAMLLAIVTDAVQIGGFPLFAEGAVTSLVDIVDLIVMVALIRLVGRLPQLNKQDSTPHSSRHC